MSVSLIRSRSVITHAIDRHRWNEIADGAVLQEDGIITAVGTFAELSAKHPDVPVIGTGEEILLPGFINGHHHVGLTPVQLGSPDMPLELWFVTRMVSRNLNLYLDTLYSAFEMIASGITTVQHIHGWVPGNLAAVEAGSNEVIRAYNDIGMRVSYSFAVRNQNRLVYQADDDFVASLPAELRPAMQRWYDRFELSLDDYIALFEGLYDRHQTSRRAKIQLAPANLHWCSDEGLTRLAETSRKYNVPLHMHLLETAYQKEYARPSRWLHRRRIYRSFRLARSTHDPRPRCLVERERHRPPGGNRHLRLPQLLVQFSPALRRCRAELVGGARRQHRYRDRRSRHQR